MGKITVLLLELFRTLSLLALIPLKDTDSRNYSKGNFPSNSHKIAKPIKKLTIL